MRIRPHSDKLQLDLHADLKMSDSETLAEGMLGTWGRVVVCVCVWRGEVAVQNLFRILV